MGNPNLGGGRTSRKGEKASIEDFFEKITASYDDVVEFLKTFGTSKQARLDLTVLYNLKVMANTSARNVTEVAQNKNCNYRAFINTIAKFGITSKDAKQIVLDAKQSIATEE
jgi:hypothetical protein